MAAWLNDVDAAVFEESASVKRYGAVGDGVTDDTTAIQAAITANAGKRVQFHDGTFLAYALNVPANTVLDLGNATLKKRPAILGDQNPGAFTGGSAVFGTSGYAPLIYASGNNVTIRGGTIDGNRANDTLGTGATWGGSFANVVNRAGITASTNADAGVTDITIEGVRFVNMVGCAINLDLTGHVVVRDCAEDNAGNNFANITGDATTLLTRGTLIFIGNKMAGDRVFNNAQNPVVLDRKESIVFVGNTVDSRDTASAWGCKFQDSYSVTITGNSFINDYIKPQSAAAFYGESFVISGNTFTTDDPATWQTGIIFGLHRVKSLTVSGNSIVNGGICVERSSDDVAVVGNTVMCSEDSREGGNSYFAIQGGANQNGGAAGKELVADNVVDLGELEDHHFYRAPNTFGDIDLRGNKVSGADSLLSIMATADTSAARVRVIGNTFDNFRAIGRINSAGLSLLAFHDNSLLSVNTDAVTNIDGTTQRALYVTAGSGTYGKLSVKRNDFDLTETSMYGVHLSLGTETIGTISVTDNDFSVADTGLSVVQAGAITLTNLRVCRNTATGAISIAATPTNSLIEGRQNLTEYAAVATGTPCTLTGAQFGGAAHVVVNMTAALAGAGTLNTPTASNIVAAIPGVVTGQTYRLRIINSSSGAFAWTLTANTGVTLNGTMTIAQNTWRDFDVTITSLTAVAVQSIGTGTFS